MALTKAKASNILLTTPSASSNDTTPATTEYVTTAIANLIDSAPANLNTLNELAAAMADNASFFSTVVPLSGGTMTGDLNFNDGRGLKFGTGLDTSVYNDGSNFYIKNNTLNQDIIFQGNDDGATGTTVLTLDISDGGAATFAGKLTTGGRLQPGEHIIFQSTSGYLQFPGASGRAWALASQGGTAAPGTNSATFGFHHWDGSSTWTNPINITASGKLGIGTDNPSRAIHIFDSTQSNQSVYFGNPAAAPYGEINYNSTGYEHLYIDSHGTTTGYGNIVFRTGPTPDTRMFIHSEGNVGIGTASPSENLHLNSDLASDHTRVHITKTSNAGTAGVSMNSYAPSHVWTIFQNDDSEGALNLFNGAGNKYPLILTKDGTVSMNVTPLAWYTGQSMFQLGAQMTLHSENGSATSNSAHISLNAQLDTDGSWEYIISNQATNYYQYEGSHNWRQTTAGTAGNDITWYNTMTLAQDSGVLQLSPIGYANFPRAHAALNIGRAGATETRAIDVWGAWSANENKSITFNHGSTATNIVGQINCLHTSPGSSLRFGKLYHSGDTATYTMELKSVSLTSAKLIMNNSNVSSDAPLNVMAPAANTGIFVGRTLSYTNPFGILPWSSADTYLSSGCHYSGGSWDYSQSTGSSSDVALFVVSGQRGVRWYNGSGGNPISWNNASDVQLFNTSGQLTASTASDRRLKDNITNLNSTDALTKLKALQAVSFEWNDTIKRKKNSGYPDGTQYGFIAQDVKEIWPDAHIISDTDEYIGDSPTHTMDENDTYYGEIEGVRQEKLIPLLVESIKAQQAMIETLQAEVAELKGT